MATTVLSSSARTRFGRVRFDVARSGRSWWQVRYADGRELAEWDTPPAAARHPRPDPQGWSSTRWEDVRKRGIVAMRLLTPDGLAGELETNNPEGRFIEFKIGGRDYAFVAGTAVASPRFCEAHLIGCVGDDGSVQCWAYEYEPHAYVANVEVAGGRCVTCRLAREECGGRDVVLVSRERLVEWAPDPTRPLAVVRARRTEHELVGAPARLVRFVDHVAGWRYRGVALRPENLGVQGVRL